MATPTPPAYQVACYYFPNYHSDPRNEKQHGRDWTEWNLVKQARPRFAGHLQPKTPLWGYTDEADPAAMAQKIAAAADCGIDAFIFDWYWYDDGPFLQRGLDAGFLGAANNRRIKFALMWANHDWIDIHPAAHDKTPALLYPGQITPKTFDRMTDHIVERYFCHPSYWRIDGCPYFSIYELFRFIKGFGDSGDACRAMRRFRDKTRAAGFADIHLNAVVWGIQILPGEQQLTNLSEMLSALQVASATSYVWVHHIELPHFPTTDYRFIMDKSFAYWHSAAAEYGVPYHPNVTVGWDSSPRTAPSSPFSNSGYPFMAGVAGNTPALFEEALLEARRFLDTRPPQERILTINAWNEWTEGSYIEPDTQTGTAYLEAIRHVFGKNA